MAGFDIITWEERYHRDLIDLSLEWLKKYDLLEPADWILLNDPQGYVLAGGGQVFFACCDGRVVGTVSAVNNGDGSFELAKMAVTEAHQNRGIGRALVLHALDFVRRQGADTAILYSHRKLQVALALYQSVGFEEIPCPNNKYEASDIKLALCL